MHSIQWREAVFTEASQLYLETTQTRLIPQSLDMSGNVASTDSDYNAYMYLDNIGKQITSVL